MSGIRRWIARQFYWLAIQIDPNEGTVIGVDVINWKKVLFIGNDTMIIGSPLDEHDEATLEWIARASIPDILTAKGH